MQLQGAFGLALKGRWVKCLHDKLLIFYQIINVVLKPVIALS